MLHGKQINEALDDLYRTMVAIRTQHNTGTSSFILMVCESQVSLHVGRNLRLIRGDEGMRGLNEPFTRNLGTCPIPGHVSRHFFVQASGRTTPAPCRMHPLPPKLPVKGEVQAAVEAAQRLGGWPALVAALDKYVRFDPLIWRLWDQTIWYQRKPEDGDYAG